ncbi:MAG: DMT family transporter [Kofleriaceae bacterium]
MVGSAFGFSVMSLLVKLASTRLPMGEIVLARGGVTLVLSYVLVVRAGLSPWGTDRRRLMFRGVLGFGGLTGYYLALALLPLAEATTLQHTTPLLTAVLAWWVLREPIGWPTVFALGCGIAGVALIAHPTGTGLDPLGVTVAIAGAACSATAYVTVRQLSRTEHPLVIVFYFPLVATPLAIPWAISSWVTPSVIDWLLLIAIGVATQAGQVFLTMALSLERAGRVTAVGYVQVMFALGWQWLVFGRWPVLATLAGAALIIAGAVTVTRFAAASAAAPTPAPTPPAPPA